MADERKVIWVDGIDEAISGLSRWEFAEDTAIEGAASVLEALRESFNETNPLIDITSDGEFLVSFSLFANDQPWARLNLSRLIVGEMKNYSEDYQKGSFAIFAQILRALAQQLDDADKDVSD